MARSTLAPFLPVEYHVARGQRPILYFNSKHLFFYSGRSMQYDTKIW